MKMCVVVAAFFALVSVSFGQSPGSALDQKPGQHGGSATRLTDLPPVMAWAGAVVHPSRVITANGERVIFATTEGKEITVPLGQLPRNVGVRFAAAIQRAQREAAAVPPPTINGLVLQRAPEGILISVRGRVVLLKGYPKEAGLADQDAVRVYAKEAGTYQYTTTAGSVATVHAFEFTGDYQAP